MLVVGVDPGVQYGICVYNTGIVPHVRTLASGKIGVKMLDDPEEVGEIVAHLSAVAAGPYMKDAVFSVEYPVHGPSMAVFAAQNRMVGVIVHILRDVATVFQVSPTMSKRAITGKGVAKKPVIVSAAERICPELMIGTKVEREAKADALAHALAFLKYGDGRVLLTGRSGRSARDAG